MSAIIGPQSKARTAGSTHMWLHLLLIGVGVLVLAVLLAIAWFAIARPVKVLPRLTPLPAFLFTDQDGLPSGDAELRGRITFLSFSYTRCGTGCADLANRLQELRGNLEAGGLYGPKVGFATISLDPTYDSPAVLRTYAAQQGIDTADWRFLTGSPTEIKGLVGGELRIYYETPDPSGAMKHDQEVILIDDQGLMRARYTLGTLTTERVMRDLDLLAREAASSGLMRQVYEASHFFTCYPD